MCCGQVGGTATRGVFSIPGDMRGLLCVFPTVYCSGAGKESVVGCVREVDVPAESTRRDFHLFSRSVGVRDSTCANSVCPFKILYRGREDSCDFRPVAVFYNSGNSKGSALLGIVTRGANTREATPFGRAPLFTSCLSFYRTACSEDSDLPLKDGVVASSSIFSCVLSVERGGRLVSREQREVFKSCHQCVARCSEKISAQLRSLSSVRRCGYHGLTEHSAGSTCTGRALGRQRLPAVSGNRSTFCCFASQVGRGTLCLLSRPRGDLSTGVRVRLTGFVRSSTHFCNYRFVVSARSPFVLTVHNTGVCSLSHAPYGRMG